VGGYATRRKSLMFPQVGKRGRNPPPLPSHKERESPAVVVLKRAPMRESGDPGEHDVRWILVSRIGRNYNAWMDLFIFIAMV
jgi:hypothetical protein